MFKQNGQWQLKGNQSKNGTHIKKQHSDTPFLNKNEKDIENSGILLYYAS
jgi:hypothetical protein